MLHVSKADLSNDRLSRQILSAFTSYFQWLHSTLLLIDACLTRENHRESVLGINTDHQGHETA